MTDKQIIIDGKKYNECEGCELHDGYMCNGARSYEPDGEAHRAICDKHIAQEFWKVYNQLARKTQECEELKEKVKAYENLALHIKCPHCNKELDLILDGTEEKVNLFDRYSKALEEIEEYVKDLKRDICNNCSWHNTDNCNPVGNVCETLGTILEIINKVKGGKE